ncbi:4,5-DOPA dioxygenase extradiol [Bacillus ectoiniformans]|uniref:DODA-type extradiol aromatic ring-opening family dioxygenase n=1 Tax=Bacillus ectoiniformans TaxID=1494429 RepID=UPI001957D75E|nr:class III extradiol ring-cleavage dioxygenase [Bacillus ectoiniformans]MBM7647412.1 4,5-DOPA dioxygenase extradiol [Bacillus ectoiniformans]
MVPSLFLAHGSPMLALEQNEYTDFLGSLGQKIKPKAIVLFTAHWESEQTIMSYRDDTYETIYDFGGFPDELYSVEYPAAGSKKIANIVMNQLESQGISVELNETRGLDHGSWTLLSRMYPKADIPVVQMSINPYLPAEEQFKLGRSLRALGEKDILVIGSGVTVHNLRVLKWGETEPESWATEFDDWLIERMEQGDTESLFQWDTLAPHAQLAVPRAEHFVPLFIAMGSGNEARGTVIHRGYQYGNLSYLCMRF